MRKSAEKARELFSKLSSFYLSVNSPPTHGWDYRKMLEMFEADDDFSFISPPNNHANDENIESSTDSPTNESSDDFEDATENSHSDTSTLSPDEEQPPAIPPRLPSNLSNAQNLAAHLEIPEVHAAAIQGIIDNARQFNSEHPRPPPRHLHGHSVPEPGQRKSTRNVKKPTNYAVFNKTGKK